MRSGERRDVALLFSGLDLLPVTDATAWHHGLRLLTLDVKHFPMFPGSASAW